MATSRTRNGHELGSQTDPEWHCFTSENAKGDGAVVFGRVTYNMMASYWPTAQAMKNMPAGLCTR
jgi:dihydrofolate reductase